MWLLEGDEKGIWVDARLLSNLRLNDNIELFSNSTAEAEVMLKETKKEECNKSKEETVYGNASCG